MCIKSHKYQLILKDKKEVARDTFVFYFERPEGFEFLAGQNMRLFFLELDADNQKRTLTIASAPHENNIMFVMRMRGSKFKNKLNSLHFGEAIEAEGPTGDTFLLHGDTTIPVVFIAGGVGIAPFRSMLLHIVHNNLQYKVTLFYSNRKEGDIIFLDELMALEKENHNIELILTLTQDSENHSWKGERKRISKEVIEKYVSRTLVTLYYVAASPEMVESVHSMLNTMGISEDYIRTKKFKGY